MRSAPLASPRRKRRCRFAPEVLEIRRVPALATPTVETLVTNDPTPVVEGTWDEATATVLQVLAGPVSYSLGSDAQLTTNGLGKWSLDLGGAAPFADGIHDIIVFTSDG